MTSHFVLLDLIKSKIVVLHKYGIKYPVSMNKGLVDLSAKIDCHIMCKI